MDTKTFLPKSRLDRSTEVPKVLWEWKDEEEIAKFSVKQILGH